MEDQENYNSRRSSIFAFAQKTGLLKAVRFLRVPHNFLTILCYHGISQVDEHLWRPQLYLSSARFQRRLQAIEALHVPVLPLEQALDQLHNGALNKPALVITFDDGWSDFASMAWPLLREYGFPATVYQTSYYSIYNRPVFDTAISYLLWKGRDCSLRDRTITGTDRTYRLAEDGAVADLTRTIHAQAAENNLGGEEKDEVLRYLAQRLGIDYDEFVESRTLQLMRPAEVAEVSRQGRMSNFIRIATSCLRTNRLFLKKFERTGIGLRKPSVNRPFTFAIPMDITGRNSGNG